jgi:hypothetical protein
MSVERDELLDEITAALRVEPSPGFAARVRAAAAGRRGGSFTTPWFPLALLSAGAMTIALLGGALVNRERGVPPPAPARPVGSDVRLSPDPPADVDMPRLERGRSERHVRDVPADDIGTIVIDPTQRVLLRAALERVGGGLPLPETAAVETVWLPIGVQALHEPEPVVIPALPPVNPLPIEPGS